MSLSCVFFANGRNALFKVRKYNVVHAPFLSNSSPAHSAQPIAGDFSSLSKKHLFWRGFARRRRL
ncbi:hypothetical protein RGR602_PB00279 (plasmid) [Rhizobium gallicum bv. gallicum R602sp]|uniref:Uncharacterized protein n=1 Tax=Rhizobium gallicum bv. gallicum R602sp TaxID=1041138 RepID=A0A0B4XB29_9HYPH|nr:hypothetical protein RGR602_PB00279 [Rhizobium gallicum bv. gallicum R602sp]